MPTDVVMPQMGESIFEGTITKWLKKPGDSVQRDEPLFEISTDKVDAEIPSPASGHAFRDQGRCGQHGADQHRRCGDRRRRWRGCQQAGRGCSSTAQAGAREGREEAGSAAKQRPQPAAGLQWRRHGCRDAADGRVDHRRHDHQVAEEGRRHRAAGRAAVRDFDRQGGRGDSLAGERHAFRDQGRGRQHRPDQHRGRRDRRRRCKGERSRGCRTGSNVERCGGFGAPGKSLLLPWPRLPLRQRMASGCAPRRWCARLPRSNSSICGRFRAPGSSGRITKDDVLQYIEKGGAPKAPQPQLQLRSTSACGTEACCRARTSRSRSATRRAGAADKMRSIIAQRMVESKRTSAHVHTVFKVDMTRIVKIREKEKAKYEQRNGVKLTYMPFITRAVVATLRKHADRQRIDGRATPSATTRTSTSASRSRSTGA